MYNKYMDLKEWLGNGSINIFGLPFSGKDTQGKRLAESVNGAFISSGEIVREMEIETGNPWTAKGDMAPTNLFYKWVLPYFERREFWDKPLILSSVGRWVGEEDQVMNVALASGHPIKAVVYLKMPEEVIKQRWQDFHNTNDRAKRADDASLVVLEKRIHEFYTKTLPILRHYRELGLLKIVDGNASKDEVFTNIVTSLTKD